MDVQSDQLVIPFKIRHPTAQYRIIGEIQYAQLFSVSPWRRGDRALEGGIGQLEVGQGGRDELVREWSGYLVSSVTG